MWQKACQRLKGSVHAVVLKTPRGNGNLEYWQTIGTAFAINHANHPTFITNAHVVAPKGSVLSNLYLAILCPGSPMCEVRVSKLERPLDLAIIQSSDAGRVAIPVTFAGRSHLDKGTSVAALGFPLPDAPELIAAGRGYLNISLRLAAGFLSNHFARAVTPDWPWIPKDHPHYELNMLVYPGLSGGPVFDSEGRVVGVTRGTMGYQRTVASYGEALRNDEVLSFLDSAAIEYHTE